MIQGGGGVGRILLPKLLLYVMLVLWSHFYGKEIRIRTYKIYRIFCRKYLGKQIINGVEQRQFRV